MEIAWKKGTPIEDLDLPYSTTRNLKASGITTIPELQFLSEDDLMRMRGIGWRAFKEIRESLKKWEASRIPNDATKKEDKQ